MKKPWWKFWKTKEEKREHIYEIGYFWAMTQLINGKSTIEVSNWSGASKTNGNFKLVNAGIRDAVKDFQAEVIDVL